MKYKICVRPSSREVLSATNNPKKWTFDLENDKQALLTAICMDYVTGEPIYAKEEKYRGYSEEEIEAILEDYNINSSFVFYIENVDEDYFVFDSGEDPEEYYGNMEEDLEEDY